MIGGSSLLHAQQGKGTLYSKKEIKGFYNDLKNKVLLCDQLDGNEVPFNIIDIGERVYFPIAIFQYGLGAYGLFEKRDLMSFPKKWDSCRKNKFCKIKAFLIKSFQKLREYRNDEAGFIL